MLDVGLLADMRRVQVVSKQRVRGDTLGSRTLRSSYFMKPRCLTCTRPVLLFGGEIPLASRYESVSRGLYGMDCPGHFMCRIRAGPVSIPDVLGPYDGVNATLTLLRHKYRVSSNTATAEDYAVSGASSSDGAFWTDCIPIPSVTISSGSNDAGVSKYEVYLWCLAMQRWPMA